MCPHKVGSSQKLMSTVASSTVNSKQVEHEAVMKGKKFFIADRQRDRTISCPGMLLFRLYGLPHLQRTNSHLHSNSESNWLRIHSVDTEWYSRNFVVKPSFFS